MTRDPRLSEQQDRALRYAAEGYRNKEIADAMGRSVRTVEHHLEAAFRALNVTDRVSAIRAAGILVPPRPRRRRVAAQDTLGLVEA